MTRLIFRFPGGRYHATPWGHHVNEGLVEWPPSPWRLLRAFIATAFAKLDVPDPPPPEHPLRRLVATLAEELPSYVLPTVSVTHSRHYMPLGKLAENREKTTLVLDASAVVGDGELAVVWPVRIDPECRALLARIVSSMGYLGRAESWVEGLLLDDADPLPTGGLAVPGGDTAGGDDGRERVSLLAPVAVGEFDQWRREHVSAVMEDMGERARAEGGKPSSKRMAKAGEPYPVDLLDCLLWDTARLQKHGWSQPPGSRRALYWRPADCLPVAPPHTSIRRGCSPAPVEAVLLCLASNARNGEVLPLFRRILPQAELLHRALVGIAGVNGREVGASLAGRDGAGCPLQGHRHMHTLPLCLDHEGRRFLDHVLLWAPMGIDGESQRAILKLKRIWTKGADDLHVTVAGMGRLADMAPVVGADVVGPARVWTSRTPFVPPRFLKKNGPNALAGQVEAELAGRRLPPAQVEIMPKDDIVERGLHRFVRSRRDTAKAPPQNCFFGLRLTFSEDVPGPILLGYASHFGLGFFEAVDR